MLMSDFSLISLRYRPARQEGVVLIVALIVLVAMTLAGLALMRSVDTANLIAGNLAYQQSAIHSADTGIEDAVNWLVANNGTDTLSNDLPSHGYYANGSDPLHSPAQNVSWDTYWNANNLASKAYPAYELSTSQDAAGNLVYYVIDRLCNDYGSATGGATCISSPTVSTSQGYDEDASSPPLNAPSVIYYRITVRVDGPRNTVSYVQAVVAM